MATLGVLGGGQLARMLAQAASRLGMRCRCLDPSPRACAGDVAELINADYTDHGALDRLIEGVDVVTCEFENVPARALDHLAGRGVVCRPGAASFASAQDRLDERRLLEGAGIEVAPYGAVASASELGRAVASLGAPGVLKARRLGYDGKGQAVVREAGDGDGAWEAVGGGPAIYERFIDFSRELSVIAVRSVDGECAFYPLVENVHKGGILHITRAPARVNETLQRDAEASARRILEALNHIGVLTIEFFELDGRLIANEIAPRVHNSGHWTIDGAQTSQFENHIRAILALPLGEASPLGPCAMVNLIGDVPAVRALVGVPGAQVHLYNKTPRPGRKVGHVTVRGTSEKEVEARVAQVESIIADS